MIKNIALHCKGSAGPSGVDAHAWHRMYSSFKEASKNVCDAITAVTRRLCTSHAPATGLDAFLACQLVPLNKNPGVRPIAIREVLRRIICKAIMRVVLKDIMLSAGPLQACSGGKCGSEAAVHAMRKIYEEQEVEGVLFVDATNAFNTLNRKIALHNIKFVCPDLQNALTNCYQSPIRLFVSGKGEITSREGTTQGDPLGMAMFALAMVPLVNKLAEVCQSVYQIWFADDATATSTFPSLRQWWDTLSLWGPRFRYYPNPAKTPLVVREENEEEAEVAFKGTNIFISTRGSNHLRAALGTSDFVEEFVGAKVKKWTEEIEKLATIASSQPHAVFAAYSHGTKNKWTYLCRTIPGCSHLLQPLEDTLHQKLLPAITG